MMGTPREKAGGLGVELLLAPGGVGSPWSRGPWCRASSALSMLLTYTQVHEGQDVDVDGQFRFSDLVIFVPWLA